ncbi:DUF1801 domain-containing protein [Flavobacterium sp. DGU11]|uniref:DUF1801 domain-containing protein n=1 Tax=Flavobacterium arundinis TaxID=3139143 RepID=A0ABU9HV60_9FLAO
MDKPKDIDDYIAGFPDDVQKLLQEVRKIVQKSAPEAIEKISYGMPAFTLNGNLVYFAAFKNHIGFYALPSGNKAFQEELSAYKTGKGSIQFPFDKPLPVKLIQKIVKFRIAENDEKAKLKKKK